MNSYIYINCDLSQGKFWLYDLTKTFQIQDFMDMIIAMWVENCVYAKHKILNHSMYYEVWAEGSCVKSVWVSGFCMLI